MVLKLKFIICCYVAVDWLRRRLVHRSVRFGCIYFHRVINHSCFFLQLHLPLFGQNMQLHSESSLSIQITAKVPDCLFFSSFRFYCVCYHVFTSESLGLPKSYSTLMLNKSFGIPKFLRIMEWNFTARWKCLKIEEKSLFAVF